MIGGMQTGNRPWARRHPTQMSQQDVVAAAGDAVEAAVAAIDLLRDTAFHASRHAPATLAEVGRQILTVQAHLDDVLTYSPAVRGAVDAAQAARTAADTSGRRVLPGRPGGVAPAPTGTRR